MVDFYDDPVQMEPMTIGDSRPAYLSLIGLAHELSAASARLDAALAPATARSLSELVAGMNCYYSNLIEGHRTLPADIERALRAAAGTVERQSMQNLAIAHIEADRWAKSQSLDRPSIAAFLLEVHRTFGQGLPAAMLRLDDGSMMISGKFRSGEVRVGRHLAPKADTLERFLERYAQVYGRKLESAKNSGANQLDAIVAAFAAHHRLAWIHPFPDGNGRVARIALDAMLRRCGINESGLWSMSRGFAKSADEYKARLAAADEPRMGDLDGRGHLSEQRLAEFCAYSARTAVDQANYMAKVFAIDDVRTRINAYFQRVRLDLKPESAHLFLHVFAMGTMERMEAGRVAGLAERTARDVLAALLAEGLMRSDTPKGRVRVGFPLHAVGYLFPNLYPTGSSDASPPSPSTPNSTGVLT